MTILAVYENGVFRPTVPVDLPEHACVRVEVLAPESVAKKAVKGEDLLEFRGTVDWPEDAVEWQRRTRGAGLS